MFPASGSAQRRTMYFGQHFVRSSLDLGQSSWVSCVEILCCLFWFNNVLFLESLVLNGFCFSSIFLGLFLQIWRESNLQPTPVLSSPADSLTSDSTLLPPHTTPYFQPG